MYAYKHRLQRTRQSQLRQAKLVQARVRVFRVFRVYVYVVCCGVL